MLPKVASHLSRAAAAFHAQSTQTLRTVLQTPSTANAGGIGWAGPGPSSSSWGSHAGAGGAKFNAGSRFYNGYTGAGRTLTQANSSTSHDGTANQTDDAEDRKKLAKRVSLATPQPVTTARRRHRSSSFSLAATDLGRDERGEKLGVLKVVQMHARFRHAAAAEHPPTISQVDSDLVGGVVQHRTHTTGASKPVLVRRNSTSADASPIDDIAEFTASTKPPPAPIPSSIIDPASPQSLVDPTTALLSSSAPVSRPDPVVITSNDRGIVLAEIQHYRQQDSPSVTGYTDCIEACIRIRPPARPITDVLEIYNEMLDRNLLPSARTYKLLLMALTNRDHELYSHIQKLVQRQSLGGEERAKDTLNEHIAALRQEDNFTPAITLFHAARKYNSLPTAVYNNLLRACAQRGNVDMAIKIYAHLERSKSLSPSPMTFGHLIAVYAHAQQLQGAREVFAEFRKASRLGQLHWLTSDAAEIEVAEEGSEKSRPYKAKASQIMVWDKMIGAYFACGQPAGALALLETMMDSKAGVEFGESDVPPPASSTFSAIIAGFCEAGDVDSALTWFDRLMNQSSPTVLAYQPVTVPTRPDTKAWQSIVSALAQHNRVDDLVNIYSQRLADHTPSSGESHALERDTVMDVLLRSLQDPQIPKARLDSILHVFRDLLPVSLRLQAVNRRRCWQLVESAIAYGKFDDALSFASLICDSVRMQVRHGERSGAMAPGEVYGRLHETKESMLAVLERLFGKDASKMPTLDVVLRALRVANSIGYKVGQSLGPKLMQLYNTTIAVTPDRKLDLLPEDWRNLVTACAITAEPNESSAVDIEALLQDLALNNAPVQQVLKSNLGPAIVDSLIRSRGVDAANNILQKLGPQFKDLWSTRSVSARYPTGSEAAPQQPTPQPSPPPKGDITPMQVNLNHSRYVDEHYPTHPTVTPLVAYDRFEAGLQRGLYPTAEVIGRLINGLGRIGELEKVKKLYEAAQKVLLALEGEKQAQSLSWFYVEDSMIVAFAHAGQLNASSIHRARIIEYGGAPSADAYGAIISCIKDTTDDATVAFGLFDESQRLGVRPNIFLYNTIISKLAKARKADHALELFQQMKASGLRPTSVTYGAVIGACCRVADAPSAELLFEEMSSQPNFRPRVPPFNTMMQLYAQTKPDRERVLYYFNAMRSAGVRPTAHTYKLLLDCYGSIQPVDFASMEDVFRRLVVERGINVSGTHWAALINAYGCVGQDLEKAISVFDSIATHPSTARSPIPLPDPIVYEALINVFVHLHRSDLIPKYLEQLSNSNVHMTAYIVNLLIKGYAADGDLEKARQIFEDLQDPPEGVAAPNNHAAHEASPQIAAVSSGAPVYREPSTWEAMVRAELGAGERDRAMALLDRMEARLFPDAVTGRIRGILHGDPLALVEGVPLSPPTSYDSNPQN